MFQFENKTAGEIACLAVHDDYQRAGLGSQLLQAVESKAMKNGISRLYTLTTRTSHWFIEHGYNETNDFNLPAAKRKSYNPERGSKILTKLI